MSTVPSPTSVLLTEMNVTVVGGSLGDPGSSLTWTTGLPQTTSVDVTDVNMDGDLDVGVDFFGSSAATFSGYTVTIGGEEFPIFQATSLFFVATPDAATSDAVIAAGASNTFQDNVEAFPICFMEGTLIDTPDGPCTVEDLQIGDPILCADGRVTETKWIGQQRVSTLFGTSERTRPVRIRAGALGKGLPHTDLTVTADHGMVLDGLVINASALVNGTTIDFVPMQELGEGYTVYHVETENHDVIRANGAASETFVDYVTRGKFDNYQEYLDLYGAERSIAEMPVPRISSARLVPARIRDTLDQQVDPVTLTA